MKLIFLVLLCAGILTSCAGAGLQDAEDQAREGQAKAAQGSTTGFSIWSMFGSSEEAVRKRLDLSLGKTKAELIASLGQPFQCNPLQTGGEICGWYDKGMSDSPVTEASQHRIFYAIDQNGIARDWNYQGMYGKHSSRDSLLPTP
jgi:hypothetical protein